MGRRAVVAFVLLAAWAGCGEGPSAPSVPSQSAAPGSVAFSFGGRIHVMRPDGSGRVRLTGGRFPREAVTDWEPAWSPNARTLAFARSFTPRSGDGSTGIYVIDAGGGAARRLPIAGDVFWPTWSPDGARLP